MTAPVDQGLERQLGVDETAIVNHGIQVYITYSALFRCHYVDYSSPCMVHMITSYGKGVW